MTELIVNINYEREDQTLSVGNKQQRLPQKFLKLVDVNCCVNLTSLLNKTDGSPQRGTLVQVNRLSSSSTQSNLFNTLIRNIVIL